MKIVTNSRPRNTLTATGRRQLKRGTWSSTCCRKSLHQEGSPIHGTWQPGRWRMPGGKLVGVVGLLHTIITESAVTRPATLANICSCRQGTNSQYLQVHPYVSTSQLSTSTNLEARNRVWLAFCMAFMWQL